MIRQLSYGVLFTSVVVAAPFSLRNKNDTIPFFYDEKEIYYTQHLFNYEPEGDS